MSKEKQIKSALISVYHKDNLDSIVLKLKDLDVTFYSTGGTQDILEKRGCSVTAVEDLTSYPSILLVRCPSAIMFSNTIFLIEPFLFISCY